MQRNPDGDMPNTMVQFPDGSEAPAVVVDTYKSLLAATPDGVKAEMAEQIPVALNADGDLVPSGPYWALRERDHRTVTVGEALKRGLQLADAYGFAGAIKGKLSEIDGAEGTSFKPIVGVDPEDVDHLKIQPIELRPVQAALDADEQPKAFLRGMSWCGLTNEAWAERIVMEARSLVTMRRKLGGESGDSGYLLPLMLVDLAKRTLASAMAISVSIDAFEDEDSETVPSMSDLTGKAREELARMLAKKFDPDSVGDPNEWGTIIRERVAPEHVRLHTLARATSAAKDKLKNAIDDIIANLKGDDGGAPGAE